MQQTSPPAASFFWHGQVAARRPRGGDSKVSNRLPARAGNCLLDRQIGFDADIDGVAGVTMLERILEAHDMRRRNCKGARHYTFTCMIRRLVRPQREHAAGMQMPGELFQSRGFVPVSYTHLTLPTNREV